MTMSEELRRGIPKATVVGRIEYTAEEVSRHKKECEAILRAMGVLEEGQSIDDLEELPGE